MLVLSALSSREGDFVEICREMGGCRRGLKFLAPLLIAMMGMADTVSAQTVTTYSNAVSQAITDNNCGTAAQITRTFTVPSFIVGDVDIGVLASHAFRSDLRITLRSPAGPTVTVMTWTGNVQSADHLNERFDDEAANPIASHANTNDSTTPTLPNYQHQSRPSNPLSAFDGQNAGGVWTLIVCDGVGADVGTYLRADLFITSTSLSVAKTSSVVSDPINNLTNPKAIPGAVIRYCILATNNGGAAHTNVALSDPVPAGMAYVPGSMRSGTTCAGASAVEDEDTIGADDTDGVSMSVSGSTISGIQASLATGASVAFVFNATMN
jgi:uncharacterized repeat protein (TIGR01451 family)